MLSLTSSYSYLISTNFQFPKSFHNPTKSLTRSLKPSYISHFSKNFQLLRSRRTREQSLLLLVCKDSVEKQQQKSESGGGRWNDWVTSALLFGFWAGLMYYVFQLTPNQTPYRDFYFVQKLLNLKGDDGFRMNEVLVALWYIMGLWPLIYGMLLIPSGRSSKSKVPVWPFAILSCFAGAYILLPYFVLWRPPPPPVDEDEIKRWPLNFLESKITAGVALAAGLGLIGYAALANGDVWKEFFQYFRESKFIHATSIDFLLLTAFAPFWVYNDMSARKWFDKGSWLLPAALIPYVGPALYLLLRPSLSELPVTSSLSEKD